MEQNSDFSNPVSPPRRGKLRRRIFWGGFVAGLVALGMWLQSLLKGVGWGTGGGNSNSKSSVAQKTSADNSKTTNKIETKPGQVPEFRLDGDKFFLRTPDGKTQKQPLEIAKIVQQVKTVKPNKEGIRARIYLRWQANTSRRDELKRELMKNGIKSLEIEWVRDDL
ncbi:MAG: hypothetical protein Tsb009_24710 [Planctomycetaceae bacterium]